MNRVMTTSKQENARKLDGIADDEHILEGLQHTQCWSSYSTTESIFPMRLAVDNITLFCISIRE